jgi:MFS family permease
VLWAGLELRQFTSGVRLFDLRDVAVFGVPWFLMAFLAGQILFAGLTSYLFKHAGDRNREWLARASGWYGAIAVGWIALFGVALYGWTVLQWAWGLLIAITLVFRCSKPPWSRQPLDQSSSGNRPG